MIKRRFYKLQHGDRNDEPSDSSSSSSSSDSEAEAEAEATDEEFEGDHGIFAAGGASEACSTSSGYESEDSSGNEVDLDASGLPIEEEDSETGKERKIQIDGQSNMTEEKELLSADFPACILKSKSVFKCRICPRIVCLNEETLRAHLKSKRHARSEKLLIDGRLKATLNSDGEIDNEDTLEKQDAEIEAKSQDPKKEKGGRQRQHRRRQNRKFKKKKVGPDSNVAKTRPTKESPAKKRHKQEK